MPRHNQLLTWTALLLTSLNLAQAQTALGSFPTTKAVFASPTLLNDGAIVFGTNEPSLYCVTHSGSTFTQRWKTTFPDLIDSTAALAPDGTLYVGCFDSKLYAVNSSTGAIIWSFTTGGFIAGSPALAGDGTIYTCSADGFLYAINPDGTLKWTHSADSPTDPYPAVELVLESTPAVGPDGTVYYGTNDGRVIAVNPSGTTKWTYATPGAGVISTTGDVSARIKSAPALSANGNIHVVTGAGYLISLLPTGTLFWDEIMVDAGQNAEASDSSPILDASGNIYTANRLGTVFAYNSAGTRIWFRTFGDIYYSSGCLDANGRLYFAYYDGATAPNTSKLVCLNTVTNFTTGTVAGTIAWTSASIQGVVDSSPILTAEGKIYFGVWGTSSTGASLSKLVAYQAAAQLGNVATLANTSWPCFGRSHMRAQRHSTSSPPTFSGSTSALLTGGKPGAASLALSTSGWHGYQWSKGAVNATTGAVSSYAQISGQNSSALRIASPLRTNAGVYQCLVSNEAGQRYSPKTYVSVLESLTPVAGGFSTVTYQPILLSGSETFAWEFAPDFKTWTAFGLTTTNLGTDATTATIKASHTVSGQTSPQLGLRWRVTAP